MAVYKVIQDIEAEDKLLGPLTLKSFIYAAIAAVLVYINLKILLSSGPLPVRLTIVIVLLFPMALFGVLASPLGRDQPTEVWLLSHVRFMLKPRVRIWDQAGINKLVTITVPQAIEKQLTKGFSQMEVQSRLSTLATTLDSRGWAVKNSTVNLSGTQGYLDGEEGASDRLIAPESVASPQSATDVRADEDILDEKNNATAHNFKTLMQVADSQRKQAMATKMDLARKDESTPSPEPINVSSYRNGSEEDSLPVEAKAEALLDSWHKRDAEIHRRSAGFHSKNKDKAKSTAKGENTAQDAVTSESRADKLELAQSGNDLSVASIAQLANRKNPIEQIGSNEVVISLH